MNKTTISSLETEVKQLRNEVKDLRNLLEKVMKDKDITKEELMRMGAHVFEVTREETKDDKNIAHPDKIKPVDLSSYA